MTDSYLPDDALLTRSERRAHLNRTHGFTCVCVELCGEDDDDDDAVQTDEIILAARSALEELRCLSRRICISGPPNRELNLKYLETARKLESAVEDGKVC